MKPSPATLLGFAPIEPDRGNSRWLDGKDFRKSSVLLDLASNGWQDRFQVLLAFPDYRHEEGKAHRVRKFTSAGNPAV